MSLIISPNVKHIYNNHFEKILNYTPNSVLKYYDILDEKVIVINIQNEEYINYLQNQFNIWFNYFKLKNLVENVSITGIKENMNDGQGSSRYSTNSPKLSEYLTNILNSFNLNILADFHKDYDSIINICKYSKVSDYFRFMKYMSGGQHYPHYDSDFVIDKNTITKYSLVMYFNNCEDGELVFCKDNRPPKTEMSFIKRDTSDWDRQVEEEEILLKIKPKAGMIVLFPHTLCHAVLPFTGEERNIVRGDLEFVRI